MKRLGLTSMKKRGFSPIGLDIGETSVKMVQLRRMSSGWAISDVAVREISHYDSENEAERNDALVQTIKKCMQGSSFSGRSVVSVVPGYQLDIFPVKLSLSGDQVIEDAIFEKVRAYLSYDVEKAVIDYIPVEADESGPEKDRQTRTLLISARREDVDSHLSLLKKAKLKPLALDIAACALARAIRYCGTDREGNVLVINAGNLHTTLTLIWKGNILLDRTILWGRENLLDSLVNRLKLDRQKANVLLRRNGLHLAKDEIGGQEGESNPNMCSKSEIVYEIVANQLEKLSAEIDKMLQYFSSEMRGAEMDVQYITGEASMIKDLDTYLGKKIGIPVKHFNPAYSLDCGKSEGTHDKDHYGAFLGVPVGLALRGIDEPYV